MRGNVACLFATALVTAPSVALAQGALGPESLLDYIQSRTDLLPQERQAYEKEIRVRFGGSALEEQGDGHDEIMVAKAILSSAIFLQIPPKVAVQGSWNGYHGALDFVPPPIAIHYEILKFQGKPPRGRPIDLAFDFPKFYSDEIAPELVAYWEEALAKKKIREWDVKETEEALAATRKKMRPLFLEKLRLLARLERDRATSNGERKRNAESAIDEVEAELNRSFRGVAVRPEVMDRGRTAFERLSLQLEATKKPLTDEDRAFDPAVYLRDAERRAREAEERQREAERERLRIEAEQRQADEERARVEEQERLEEERRAREEEERLEREQREAEQRRDRERLQALAEKKERERLERQRRQAERREKRLQEAKEREAREAREREERNGSGTIDWGPKHILERLTPVVQTWLGTPYLWGGTQKRAGTDCSGFTQGVYREAFSRPIPRTSRDQAFEGREAGDALLPGDLVFFDMKDVGRISHVGIVTKAGKLGAGGVEFAHAGSSTGVTHADLSARYFRKAYRGARRILSP